MLDARGRIFEGLILWALPGCRQHLFGQGDDPNPRRGISLRAGPPLLHHQSSMAHHAHRPQTQTYTKHRPGQGRVDMVVFMQV